MSEQFEFALVGLDAATRRPLGVAGSFALPPVEGGPAEVHARCMVCDRRGVLRADGVPALEVRVRVRLARRALREAGCTHVREG